MTSRPLSGCLSKRRHDNEAKEQLFFVATERENRQGSWCRVNTICCVWVIFVTQYVVFFRLELQYTTCKNIWPNPHLNFLFLSTKQRIFLKRFFEDCYPQVSNIFITEWFFQKQKRLWLGANTSCKKQFICGLLMNHRRSATAFANASGNICHV